MRVLINPPSPPHTFSLSLSSDNGLVGDDDLILIRANQALNLPTHTYTHLLPQATLGLAATSMWLITPPHATHTRTHAHTLSHTESVTLSSGDGVGGNEHVMSTLFPSAQLRRCVRHLHLGLGFRFCVLLQAMVLVNYISLLSLSLSLSLSLFSLPPSLPLSLGVGPS